MESNIQIICSTIICISFLIYSYFIVKLSSNGGKIKNDGYKPNNIIKTCSNPPRGTDGDDA